MFTIDSYIANWGTVFVITVIVLLSVGLLWGLLKYKEDMKLTKIKKKIFHSSGSTWIIKKNESNTGKFLRPILTKKTSVWVQRVFMTIFLVMLFFNFFTSGVAVGASTPTVTQPTSKIASTNKNSNLVLYKGLYASIIQNLKSNERQYFTSFKDLEALGSILQDMNNTIGSIGKYQFNKKVPIFDKLLTDVLNYTFENRDVNATKFFFNSTSRTIFVAETLDHYGLLDMPLLEITDRLGKNITSDTIFQEFTNKTLKEVFRQSLLIEFASHPPAIAPINEKYEPALSHALQLGIITLPDLGLPANGITYEDYLNGQKPVIEINNKNVTNKEGIQFRNLTASSFTVSGQNTVNVTIPTYGDYFTAAELTNVLSPYYLEQFRKEVVPYSFLVDFNSVPDQVLNPVTQSMNLIYWSNLTIDYYNVTSPSYDYVYNDTLQDYQYVLTNKNDTIPYYLEQVGGTWLQEGDQWIYNNVTSGRWVWNTTTLQSMGLSEYAPNYKMGLSISGTNFKTSLSSSNPSLEMISGKIDQSTSQNQTFTVGLQQQIYTNDNVTYTNNSIMDLFINRTLLLNNDFYYFPEYQYPMNVSDIQLSLDQAGNYIVPSNAILITNMSQLYNYLTTYNQTETVYNYISQNIGFNVSIYLPELAIGDLYNHTASGYLTLNRSVSENWNVHAYTLGDTFAKNYDRFYPAYQLYFATGLDSYYKSPDTLFVFERQSADGAQAMGKIEAIKTGDMYNQTLIQNYAMDYMPIETNITMTETYDNIIRNYNNQKNWDKVKSLFDQNYETSDTVSTLQYLDNIHSVVKDDQLLQTIMDTNNSIVQTIMDNLYQYYNSSDGMFDDDVSKTYQTLQIFSELNFSRSMDTLFTSQDALILVNHSLRQFVKVTDAQSEFKQAGINKSISLASSKTTDIKEERFIYQLFKKTENLTVIPNSVVQTNTPATSQPNSKIMSTSNQLHPDGRIIAQKKQSQIKKTSTDQMVAYMSPNDLQFIVRRKRFSYSIKRSSPVQSL